MTRFAGDCHRVVVLLLLSAAAWCGCSASPPAGQAPAARQVGDNTDPCATRLHDLCGALLFYFAQHETLPATLAELPAMPDQDATLTWQCTETNRPYLYDPQGLPGGLDGSRLVVADAVGHEGVRWGIRIDDPRPGLPLVCRVVRLP